MRLAQGNIWDVVPSLRERDLLCITTNAQTHGNGPLVMGKGIALEAARRFPGLKEEAGRRVYRHFEHARALDAPGYPYGLIILPPNSVPGLTFHLGLFQVKHHFKDRADLDLIRRATLHLLSAIRPEGPVPARGNLLRPCAGATVHLNFPGIGAGRLNREAVLPLLTPLPDTVTVWEFPG